VLAAGGIYAAVSVYGAHKVTSRRRKLPAIAPGFIAPGWEPVSFLSRADRKRLAGWWFAGEREDGARRALVLIHGHGQNRIDENWGTHEIARAFWQRGYAVLVFDLRGHGESAHDRLSFGVRERNDVLGALDFVTGRGLAPREVAFAGISYGAAALLLAAPAMPEAGAIVADSAYAEIWPVILAQIPRFSPLLSRLRPAPGIRIAAWLLYRINLQRACPLDAMPALAQRPILFIHGAADDYVPPHHSQRLFAAHGHPASELWLVPGARHAQTYTTSPDEFIARLARFIDEQQCDSAP